jgi:hypothetical protein
MHSGKSSPASESDPLSPADLNAARGTLREALSALRNFAELLHSLRIGSKALLAVLPDVAAGCAPMQRAVDSLLASVSVRASTHEATSALGAYFTPRLTLLEQELAGARNRPLLAKSRLLLERLITTLSLELDTARGLLDLLVDAVSHGSTHVDLAELVEQSFAGSPSGGSWHRPQIVASMSFIQTGVEVELNPRIATALFALGVELVAQAQIGSPHLSVDHAGGRHRVHIVPCARRDGEDLILIARGVIAPTLTCLQAVAAISDVALSYDEADASLCFAFPAQSCAQNGDRAG